MPVYYADSSALVKLAVDEPESEALRAFCADGDVVSCELALTEVPMAVRRAAADARADRHAMARAAELLARLALVALEADLLAVAGSFDEPSLRSLDAIHLTAASTVYPFDAFLSYDKRQAAAARELGFPVASPGAVT